MAVFGSLLFNIAFYLWTAVVVIFLCLPALRNGLGGGFIAKKAPFR